MLVPRRCVCLRLGVKSAGGRRVRKHFPSEYSFAICLISLAFPEAQRGKNPHLLPLPLHIKYTYLSYNAVVLTQFLRIFMQSDTADDSSGHLKSRSSCFLFSFFPSVRRHENSTPNCFVHANRSHTRVHVQFTAASIGHAYEGIL